MLAPIAASVATWEWQVWLDDDEEEEEEEQEEEEEHWVRFCPCALGCNVAVPAAVPVAARPVAARPVAGSADRRAADAPVGGRRGDRVRPGAARQALPLGCRGA